MSISPKKDRLVLDKKGLHHNETDYTYPIPVGKLRNFRDRYKNVSVDLTREGNRYFLVFYDRFKGMVAKGRVKKLDAVNLVRNRLSKLGYDDAHAMSELEFTKMIDNLDLSYID